MKLRSLFSIPVLLLLLTAAAVPAAFAGKAAPVRTFQQILESGTLRVGVSLFTPWTLKDKNGKLTGSEIDVAKKLATDMGLKPQLKLYVWEKLIPALNNGEIDIIIGGMAITPQRALKVNFSQPYASSGISLATNLEATRHIGSLEELNNKKTRIAVIAATVSENIARRIFDKASLVVFKKSETAKKALLAGKVHAYLESKPLPRFIALEHPEKVDVPLSGPLLEYKTGFAINQGDADFLSFLNAWITSRKADTWLKATHDYWFKSLKWRQHTQ